MNFLEGSMDFVRVRACALSMALLFCITLAVSARAEEARDHYHWRPASETNAPRPWAVLLPGSSGLTILGDDQHYFRAAAWLNEHGVDALVIDYHRATRLVPASRDGEAGERMAIIVADALASMRELGRASTACPGAAIGWSLGAEGAWRLAAGADVRAAVLFYPTVRHVSPYRNAAPILALQGGADNVTPEHELRAFAAARADGSAPLEIVTLADAEHGFDVSSISPPRTMRFPPLIGQRATFGYSADASARARAAVEHFLAAQGVIGGTCAPS